MNKLNHKFTKFIPENLEDNTLYISVEYSTAIHKCACGCGNKVVTPFSRDDWRLIFKGDVVSLRPSIGNWNFPCKSHYWITDSAIEWVDDEVPTSVSEQQKDNGLIGLVIHKINNFFRRK